MFFPLTSTCQSRILPVYAIASGAVNSMRGAAVLSAAQDAIVIDIGGITTDLGVIKGGFPRQASTRVKVRFIFPVCGSVFSLRHLGSGMTCCDLYQIAKRQWHLTKSRIDFLINLLINPQLCFTLDNLNNLPIFLELFQTIWQLLQVGMDKKLHHIRIANRIQLLQVASLFAQNSARQEGFKISLENNSFKSNFSSWYLYKRLVLRHFSGSSWFPDGSL